MIGKHQLCSVKELIVANRIRCTRGHKDGTNFKEFYLLS